MIAPTTTDRTEGALGGRIAKRFVLLAGLLAAITALCAAPAFAAYSHAPAELKFPLGGGCGTIESIAVAEAEGYVYVACAFGSYPNEADQIKRFDLDGNPAPFSASAPYISGNTLTGDPAALSGNFSHPLFIAVDNSSSVNHGKLFVTSSPNVDIFSPSGLQTGAVVQPQEGSLFNQFHGVEVGPDGSVYVTSSYPGGRVSKYNPDLQEIRRLYTGITNVGGGPHVEEVKVDATGAAWVRGDGEIRKYEADQFTEELEPGFTGLFGGVDLTPFIAKRSPVAPDLFGAGAFDVDLTDNDVYIDRGDRVETYSPGAPGEFSFQNAPTFGLGSLSGSEAVAVTVDHHVYAATNTNEVVRFGPGALLPDVHTFVPDVDEVGHVDATVRGKIELAGGGDITKCAVEYGADTSYSGGSVKCDPDPAASPPGSNFGADTEVSATITGLTMGSTYHYRLTAENSGGKNFGIDRLLVPAYVLKVKTLPVTELNDGGATLNGSFDPDGLTTEYHFEYGVTDSYGLETDPVKGIGGSGVTPVSTVLTGLPKGKTFHYRLVATNANGTTPGGDQVVRSASPPDIFGVRATEVTSSSALISASINPTGFATTYRFEYGNTPDYGHVIPITDAEIGSGSDPVEVSQRVEGLASGVTQHFRVVAENQWGATASPDTTFDYTPPLCPNNHVRQETGASFLPDCRAYELVSPGSAGSATLVPSRTVNDNSIQGFASSPARFTFYSTYSTVEGLNSPIGLYDMFMSTRTNTGWVTTVPGLQDADAAYTGNKQCSEAMDRCIDHSTIGGGEHVSESAPYLYTAAGALVGRLPTNLSVVPGGAQFNGKQAISGDLNHFVFSSTNIAFAPGGQVIGLGSAYDNDIGARTVTVISKLPNGADIPLDGAASAEPIDFRGVSTNGSHILMQTPAAGGLKHLFMRVNKAVTYDISRGADVQPIGMTRTGGKAFFVTAARLTSDDTDNSTDMYMWQENGPNGVDELTRVSQGNGQGDGKGCNASWIAACGVAPLETEYAHPSADGGVVGGGSLNTKVSAPGNDDLFAEVSGDIYFYSPEILDPERAAIRNQRNLYVFRNGAAHLVSTLDPGTTVSRMQISPNGQHAALRTKSRLTSYDNRGFSEIYSFDADNGAIHCASCIPSGAPPRDNVEASGAGRFMSNDGRVFFSTPDALVPRDQNGKIIDTYEYVDGRPQLISSGLGTRDFSGGSGVLSFLTKPEHIGLESVSRDGTDVFFSTYETLVASDKNGDFIKFYDARTGGGFPDEAVVAPCAAADECHGAGSSEPLAPTINSGGNLGAGGNVVPEKTKAKKKKKQKKKKQQGKKKKTRKGSAKKSAHRNAGGRNHG